ncbi:MAG: TIGR03936 family radical SAM-associated protein [bacterium]|jgi:radical SAM-linked protein
MPQKLWARLIKEADIRFISHLDLLGTVEKALRRARIPIALSQGYNPHPKIAFAAALPVGVTSSGEYIEFLLQEPLLPNSFCQELNKQLPDGLAIIEAKEVNRKLPALMAVVNLAVYQVAFIYDNKTQVGKLTAAWQDFFAQAQIIVQRKTKKGVRTFDLMPLLWQQQLVETAAGVAQINLRLKLNPEGSVRPEEVIQVFKDATGWEGKISSIHRQGLYILEEGKIYSPLAWAERQLIFEK